MNGPELRQRAAAPASDDNFDNNSGVKALPKPGGLDVLGVLFASVAVVLLGFVAWNTIAALFIRPTAPLKKPSAPPAALGFKLPHIFTPEELAQYTETGKSGVVLVACMGEVYDVSSGLKHYGSDGGYGFFAGRDSSRSFVTGDFKNHLDDDVAAFSAEEHAGLVGWRDFYRNHKEYKYVGKVVGRFYDSEGRASDLFRQSETLALQHTKAAEAKAEAKREATELAKAALAKEDDGREVLCDVSWTAEDGGWVNCAEGRMPRKFAVPASGGGEESERCLCVIGYKKEGQGKEYPGCPDDASECQATPAEGDYGNDEL